MNYLVTIDHELKIIRYTPSGLLTTEYIGTAWKEILQLNEFTHLKYNLLSDYRQAISGLEESDIYLICDFLLSIKDILHDKKQALVVNKPIDTALSILFGEEIKSRTGFIVEVFYTEMAALNWLKQ